MSIKLIVGLRNPGPAYEYTRHNAGAWFVDALMQQTNTSLRLEKKFQGDIGLMTLGTQVCRILLPQVFMNLNGTSVAAMAQFYQITPEEILIVHDDLDLPLGTIRVKTGGGHGGHNGLRSVARALSSTAFHRVRVGIGHPGQKTLVHDYVLGKPLASDREHILDAIARALKEMPLLIIGDMATVMNHLH